MFNNTALSMNINLKENYLPGVSICISAYKTQNYIKECLDSIKTQSWFRDHDNYEILIGVDGCKETLEKIKEIKDNYSNLRIFFLEHNHGTYITSNTVIKHSKYKWILRFDSDDIMKPDMVKTLMEISERNPYVVRFMLENFGDIKNRQKVYLSYGCCFFRHSVFDFLGGYKDWRCSGDSDFLNRAERYWKICKTKEILFLRRIHSEGLTSCVSYGFNSPKRKEYQKFILTHSNYISDTQCRNCFIKTADFIEV